MKLSGLIFILFKLLWLPNLYADCADFHYYEQNVQFSRQSPDGNTCWLSVNPDGRRLVYRNYLFDQDGLMMVFNSYGNGSNTTHTGARVFYFLPVYPLAPTVFFNQDHALVTTSANYHLIMDTQSGRWTQVSDGQIKEDSRIRRDNRGGVELSSFKNILLLDAGFTLGRDPRWNSQNSSRLVDKNNQSCDIKNELIYKYDSQGDIQMRYPNMSELYQFLVLQCSHLDLSPFTKAL